MDWRAAAGSGSGAPRSDAAGAEPVGRGPGEEAVEQGGGDAGEELGGQVDRQLVPLHVAAGDLLDEHRAEGASGVDGGAGRRGDRDDGREDDQADRDAGEPGGGLAVDDAEDGEHQDERADELGGECLRHADVSALYAATPRPTSLAFWPRTPMIAAAPTMAPTTWAPMYAGTWLHGNLPVTARPEGDRRVDVVATDVPEGVDGGDHDRAERQGDHPQVGHRERRIAVDDQSGGDRPHPDEHQKRRPDGLSTQALEQIGLVKHARSSSLD